MEDEKAKLITEHAEKLRDAEKKRKNMIDALPTRAKNKFPIPK